MNNRIPSVFIVPIGWLADTYGKRTPIVTRIVISNDIMVFPAAKQENGQ
jgi:hypothetical protein